MSIGFSGRHHTKETREKMKKAITLALASPKVRAKISAAGMGRKHTPEARAKMSASIILALSSPEVREKMGATHRGKKRTPEACANNSAAQMGKKHTPETCAKMSRSQTGRKHTEETKAKLRIASTGKKLSREAREKIRVARLGSKATPETCAKMRVSITRSHQSPVLRAKMRATTLRHFQDPVYCAKYAKGMHMKPNKAELQLLALLEEFYPGEWEYTGDFSFVINGKNPDFVSCNGGKLVIELFGDYWHKGDDPKARAKVFAPFGYKTLVIWEREIKEKKKLTRRIHRFMKTNNSHKKGEIK